MESLNNYIDINTFRPCMEKLYKLCSSKKVDNEVYHYTNLKALNSILENGTLRATDCRFLNDKSEVKHGEDFVRIKVFKNKVDPINESIFPMTISFCAEKDEITQWAIYAKELGVSIGLDFNISTLSLKGSCLSFEISDNASSTTIKSLPYKIPLEVYYVDILGDDSNADKIGKNFYYIYKKIQKMQGENRIPPNYEAAFVKLFSTLIKSKKFEFEKESRLIFIPVHSMGHNSKFGFNESSFSLKPYTELFYSCEGNDGVRYRIGLPISYIGIGPGRDQKRAFDSVIMRLENGKVLVCDIDFIDFKKRLKKYIDILIKHTNIVIDIEKFIENIYKSSITIPLKSFISTDNYSKAKEIIKKVKDDLHRSMSRDNAMKIFVKNMESNYLSWHGIIVSISESPYVFS